ncbi:hypothetical protein GCM10011588_68820 [Nocardia jinanensis]|uniref:Uncharacterized protein n=2 Tax=Nocardia jinanensis TaxID=382504 RepID=A0A917RZI8_9NOCA|nr:hypothetical protein GCM10011588_68820 [Nocardia jinanensis]
MMLTPELVGDLLLIALAMEEAVAMWAERRQAEQDSNVRQLARRQGTSLREIATLTRGADDARARAWVKATIASDAPTEDGRHGMLRKHLPNLDWDTIYNWATGASSETGGRVGSAAAGDRTSALMPPRYRSRRRCYCGCGGKATHTGRADGITLVTGCELSMQRWVHTGEYRTHAQLEQSRRRR